MIHNSRAICSIAALTITLFYAAPATAFQVQPSEDRSSESSKITLVTRSILETIRVLNDFIRQEKDLEKRNLLVRRLNRFSDRINSLATNLGNFRNSLTDPDLDAERALANIEELESDLRAASRTLQTIASDLDLQDQAEVVALQQRLRALVFQRVTLIERMRRELSQANGQIDLQTIRRNADNAYQIAQQTQLEVATFLESLRSTPIQ